MRYLLPFIQKDLEKKMVFIGGPRQCGKTTLAQALLAKNKKSGLYLNWDRMSDRKMILSAQWSDDDQLLIFDEVHKYKKWKTLIKGYYDTEKDKHQFLVTGSARLDLYQRGGDSLLGRYHYWRLHPFSLYDLPEKISSEDALKRLLTVGGFPEVFIENDLRESKRWARQRISKIIQEDVRDLEQIQNIGLLELLVDYLKDRVGSTLSYLSIAQELQVSPITVKKWIQILEKMYVIFTVTGYDKKITRAVHKPIKVYFYNTGDVAENEAMRFENLVANHLIQRNHFHEDYYGLKTNLFYVKDKNQREVDFLITINNKVEELIEVKLSNDVPSKNLIVFADILKPNQATQIVLNIKKNWSKNALHIKNPISYFNSLKR